MKSKAAKARANRRARLNRATNAYTTADNFEMLLARQPAPTLAISTAPSIADKIRMRFLADEYDEAQRARGDARRVTRE